MAQLDRLLALLPSDKTGILSLDEGALARVEHAGDGESRPVTRMPLTGSQIVALLREVAAPESAERIERGLAASFVYLSGEGSFSARADVADGKWRVRIANTEPPVLALVTDALVERLENGASQAGKITRPSGPLQTEPTARVHDRTARSTAAEQIDDLLRLTVARSASDLHLRSGEPPILRCHGDMARIESSAPLRGDEVAALIDATMSATAREQFAATKDCDYAYELPGSARFRVNAFNDRSGVSAVFRQIPPAVVTADELGLAPEIQRLTALTRGLVLVTGPTGSGKSTTLGALIDLVNRTRSDHIVTIEDPIEFVHQSQRCIVSQREIGTHTRSFKTALRAALREDPDVVLIGEMRDLETVSIALETAETGHLVFATLHTTTAAMTIDRIIDQFPGDQQEQIRVMLADSLRGVISQTLIRRIGGGRVAAREVLFNTPAVANLIRERKTFQVQAILQTSKRLGMVTMNDALIELIDAGQVSVEEAAANATDRAAFLAAARTKGYDISTFEAELGLHRGRPAGTISAA